MKTKKTFSAAIVAASVGVAATLMTSTDAVAQYRVGNDGRALDASNRIGSGGLNAAAPGSRQLPYGYLGNDIVTGDVTGGRQFRGFVPYTDPRAFRGTTADTTSDLFIRESSGAPYGGVNANNANIVQPFYGSSRAVPPPRGFVEQSIGSGAYVPAPVITRSPNDLRLGDPLGLQTVVLPQPGQLVLPGPVDPNTQTNSLITASPLYGIRQWNPNNEADQEFLDSNLGTGGTTAQGLKVDQAVLDQWRREVDEQQAGSNEVDQNGNPLPGANQTATGALPSPMESPNNQALNNRLSQTSQQTGALGASGSTRAGVRQRLLSSPRQQSAQYDELQKRLERYRAMTPQEEAQQANQQFNQDVRAAAAEKAKQKQQQDEKNKLPGDVTPAPLNGGAPNATPGAMNPMGGAARPGGTTLANGGAGSMTPGAGTRGETGRNIPAPAGGGGGASPSPMPSGAGGGNLPAGGDLGNGAGVAPLQIKSLAEGVKAKGLSEVLKEAETAMKAGKYNSALEQYETAEQIAPNNPLILMGRANAELGQSYYARADNHLRQAFMQDQALLMGQYDIRSWLGQDRLEFLVKDLKEIARREEHESRPVFLLAYIAYNTGNERRAAAYLDLAEKRAGNSDPVFQMVRKHWSLPKDAAPNAEDLNK